MSGNEERKKSFWKKPEGIGAMIMLAAGAVAIAFSASTIIAFISSILASVVGIVVLGFVAAIIIFAWRDERLKTSIRYVMKAWMKNLAGAIGVKINKIAILEGYVDDLKAKRIKMVKGRKTMMRQVANVEGKKQKRQSQYDGFKDLAMAARRKGDESLARRNAGKAQQLDSVITKYQAMVDKMAFLMKVIMRMEKASDTMIDEISFKVEIKKEEYEMMKTSHGVISDAWAIVKGGTSQKQLYDEAWDYVTEQTEFRVMDMENMLHRMQGFMDNVDLQNEAALEKGLVKLDEWEKSLNNSFDEGFDFLSATDKPIEFAQAQRDEKAGVKEKVKVRATSAPKEKVSGGGSKYFN
jgi:phage shock protein A